MARPSVHLITSLGLSLPYWKLAKYALAPAVAVGVGVFVDLDHLADFVDARLRKDRHLVILPLHGWELMVVGWLTWLATGRRVWLAVACSAYSLHLSLDLLVNKPRAWYGYSLLYRASRGFDPKAIWPDGVQTHTWMKAKSIWQLWRFI